VRGAGTVTPSCAECEYSFETNVDYTRYCRAEGTAETQEARARFLAADPTAALNRTWCPQFVPTVGLLRRIGRALW
jgi:hypothetical protein